MRNKRYRRGGYAPTQPLTIKGMREMVGDISPSAQVQVNALAEQITQKMHAHSVKRTGRQIHFGTGYATELIGALVRWQWATTCQRCGCRRMKLSTGRYICPNCD